MKYCAGVYALPEIIYTTEVEAPDEEQAEELALEEFYRDSETIGEQRFIWLQKNVQYVNLTEIPKIPKE